MIHRLTLVAGAFVATAIVSFAAGSQSLPAPGPETAAAEEAVAAAPVVAPQATPAPVATPMAQTVTDTVYVLPTPEPAVVHVTRQAPPTVVRTKRPPSSPTATSTPRQRAGDDDRAGEDEHEGEHEDEADSGEHEDEGD